MRAAKTAIANVSRLQHKPFTAGTNLGDGTA
jgi:hypothetical protein